MIKRLDVKWSLFWNIQKETGVLFFCSGGEVVHLTPSVVWNWAAHEFQLQAAVSPRRKTISQIGFLHSPYFAQMFNCWQNKNKRKQNQINILLIVHHLTCCQPLRSHYCENQMTKLGKQNFWLIFLFYPPSPGQGGTFLDKTVFFKYLDFST